MLNQKLLHQLATLVEIKKTLSGMNMSLVHLDDVIGMASKNLHVSVFEETDVMACEEAAPEQKEPTEYKLEETPDETVTYKRNKTLDYIKKSIISIEAQMDLMNVLKENFTGEELDKLKTDMFICQGSIHAYRSLLHFMTGSHL